MEVGNALLVPAMMVFFCTTQQQAISWWLAFACVPMCASLVLGGLYWRAKLHQLEGDARTMQAFLPHADRWQVPLLVLSMAALLVSAAAWIIGLGASTGDRISITIAAVLAGLEYVNYYHRQLQHLTTRRTLSG